MEADEAEEEMGSLESIFGEELEVLDPREFRLRLGGAWLHLVLPSAYPASAPPEPRIYAAEDAPALPAARAERVCAALQRQFEPGSICVFDWATLAREMLGEEAGDAGGEPEEEEAATAGTAECSVKLEAAAAEAVGASLAKAGFEAYPGGLFSNAKAGITVNVAAELTVTVDGVEADDLDDFVTLQLEAPAGFGARLLEWTAAQRGDGFTTGPEPEPDTERKDFLPSPEELGVDRERALEIYTWGKAFRKTAPPQSQANFNAGILNGRGGGADLRVDNGLTEAVQRNVSSCSLFPRWIEMCIHKIESEGLSAVSINCTKGRHRSVAAAEILRMHYYPKAQVIHTSPAIKH